jgi:hypothetical protein
MDSQCHIYITAAIQFFHGAKNLLDGLHHSRAVGGFSSSVLVGLFRDDPHTFHFVVGGIPQRLVLENDSLR